MQNDCETDTERLWSGCKTTEERAPNECETDTKRGPPRFERIAPPRPRPRPCSSSGPNPTILQCKMGNLSDPWPRTSDCKTEVKRGRSLRPSILSLGGDEHTSPSQVSVVTPRSLARRRQVAQEGHPRQSFDDVKRGRSLKKIISALSLALLPVLNVFLILFLLMGICALPLPPARI